MKKIMVLLLPVLVACSSTKNSSTPNGNAGLVIDGKTFGTLFQQRAAEYRALCFQAFNTAHFRLDQLLQQPSVKPRAIITDLDETIFDNSAYQASQALKGKDYEVPTWYEWTARAAADSVPGAPSFLRYAASNGVTIYYITNRDEKEREGTLANLKKLNLPNADNEHLLPRQPNTASTKEPRRQQVMNTYNVVLLLGDNLADFSSLFDKKPEAERRQNTDLSAHDFGNRFIVLPNPVYGDWESAIYNYGRLTQYQKDSVMRAVLKGY